MGVERELADYLKGFAKRLRLRKWWFAIQSFLWIGGLGALGVQLLGRIWPVRYLLWWTVLPVALVFLIGSVYYVFKRWHPLQVARQVDLEAGLKERLSTSYAIGIKDVAPEGIDAELITHLHEDALGAVRQLPAKTVFPLKVRKRSLIAAGILIGIAIVLACYPNPMGDILAKRDAVATAAEIQAEKAEKLADDLSENEELTPEEREELKKRLEALAEQLRENDGDIEEALADLNSLERDLQERLDPAFASQQAAMEMMMQQLAQLKQSTSADAEEEVGLDEMESLSELLDELENMDQEQAEALTAGLSQMSASAAQSGDMALASALAEMAQAVRSGDLEAGKRAAAEAAKLMQESQQNIRAQEVAQNALSQVQGWRQSMLAASSGEGRQTAQASESSQGSGQSSGQRPGNSPGGGGGTQADQLPGSNSSGQAKRPDREDVDTAVEDYYPSIYAPVAEQNNPDTELTIAGQDSGMGEYQEKQWSDPMSGANTDVLTPYQDVFYDYYNAASEAMDQRYIPVGLKDYVRQYFLEIEP